jgi:flagellar biosynthesis GTPase FlhF
MNEANGMKIKSYFAKSVDEAISQARVELGADALLLNTRKIAGAGAGYEVVMGVTGSTPAPKPAAPSTPKAAGHIQANPQVQASAMSSRAPWCVPQRIHLQCSGPYPRSPRCMRT